MFNVNGTTITLSRGDTGSVRLKAKAKRRDTGADFTFGERDRALFTIKGSGQIVKQRAYPIVNNRFTVVFMNADTDQFSAGQYSWDVRYVINPYYDEDPPEGPWTPYADLTFPVAKGTKATHEGTYYIANQVISTSEDFDPDHWNFADYRIPVDGDQVITPNQPMAAQLLTVVGEI